ncbi:MAG: acyl-CoA carboxylase subunit epsilon [Rothia sp. (in: high G+C Gram-positive bacteria)]|nr:acyl-CoA carboxylase subunit epsilon [Rothia sp. (in: high G+C Gram-positive bacteria)]
MATSHPLSFLGLGKKTSASSSEGTAVDGEQPLAEAPLFSVTRGNPTDEELAALTAVLLSRQVQEHQKSEETAFELWQRRLNTTQQLGARLRPGPGSWKRARPQ